MVLPIEIAVICLVGAIYYGYHAFQGPEPKTTPDTSRTASATPTAAPTVSTTRLVNKKARFAIGVPDKVIAKKVGFTVQMMTADKTMSVLAGPAEIGTISKSSKSFIAAMKQSYKHVRVVRSEARKVGGHKGKLTYGRAQNAKKVEISFVNVVVKAKPRNYAINAFTAADSDPLFVVPRVNAIIDSFEVIK
jgi:hypothetical protein